MPNMMPLATLSALSVHRFADEFPYLSDEETLELAQDIEAHGLLHPVVLFENEILDGRNRLRALAKTNLTNVPVEEYTGTDPIGYIVSLNLARRHLTVGQRAALAVAALPYYEAQAKERQVAAGLSNLGQSAQSSAGEFTGTGDARDLVAEKFGVGGQSVTRAKALSFNAPDLFAEVKSGERTVNDAYNELKKRQDASPGATPGDKAKPEDPHARFEARVDRAITSLSDAIEDHVRGGHWTADDTRYVESNLLNILRIVRGDAK